MSRDHDYYKEIGIGEREAVVDLARGIYNWQVSILHIDSGVGASFPAFITDYSETFQSDWNEETYFGRNDKVGRHAGTSRTISLSLDLPSYSVADARANMHQIEHLVATMYPSYTNSNNTGVLQSYPLVKVKFANLIRNSDKKNDYNAIQTGLAGWIPNLTINPVLESGFHSVSTTADSLPADPNQGPPPSATRAKEIERLYSKDRKGGILMPKVWQVSFSLRVVHEHKLGWHGRGWISKRQRFPYGIDKAFTEAQTGYGTSIIDSDRVKQIREAEMKRILTIQANRQKGEESELTNSGNRYGVRQVDESASGGSRFGTDASASPTTNEFEVY